MTGRVWLRVRSLRGRCTILFGEDGGVNRGDWVWIRADRTIRERTATNIQLISDLCDLTVPSSALDYVNLDDGIVGLAGTVSSLLGLWSQWKKTA